MYQFVGNLCIHALPAVSHHNMTVARRKRSGTVSPLTRTPSHWRLAVLWMSGMVNSRCILAPLYLAQRNVARDPPVFQHLWTSGICFGALQLWFPSSNDKKTFTN